MSDSNTPAGFAAMNLAAPLLKAVEDVGYEQPSPIQAKSIPVLRRQERVKPPLLRCHCFHAWI